MSDPTVSPPKPRRRRFALSLRVLMLIVRGLMGWKARKVVAVGKATACPGTHARFHDRLCPATGKRGRG